MVHQHTDGCEALSAVTHSLEIVSEPWNSELSQNLNLKTQFWLIFDAESKSAFQMVRTVGAHIVGAVLCPHLASEMGSMFQAQGQARVKNGMKHIGEETFVQACLCFLTADTMHHRWFFDTSCHDVDFKCAPSCLPLLPSVYVGGSHQEAFFL